MEGWLPSLWGAEDDEKNPFRALRKQIDSLFEDWDKALPVSAGGFLRVKSNVSETDSEICITAELPGVEEKDLDITVSGNQIVIKGEKKSEEEEKKEEEGRQFHRVERSYGSFQRSLAVPFEIDADAVSAEFKNGVLTVTVKKPPEIKEKTKKIEVKST